MKTGGEFLRVIPVERDANGAPLEPEERPATEAVTMPVEVSLGSAPVSPGASNPTGTMRGMLGVETTAGDVAQSVSTRCELCEHWRRDVWLSHLKAIENTPDGRAQIDRLRGELLGRQEGALSATPEDLHAIDFTIRSDFGICAAFTESERMPVACPYYGGCPEDDQRFNARTMTNRRAASAAFDQVMRMAQGREA